MTREPSKPPDSFILYGHRSHPDHPNGDFFTHLSNTPRTARLYGKESVWEIQMRRVKLEENELEGPYWGFWDYESTLLKSAARFTMVYYRRAAMEMCFPYGVEAVVKAGRGEVVNLVVEDSREIGANE